VKIAVALLTCDRVEYTAKTLETFARHNDLDRFVLLHADDGSEDTRNEDIAQSYGFTTVVSHEHRRGWLVTRTRLIRRAAKRADWILNLENDIETARPFPWPLFEYAAKDRGVSCLRLYHRWKDRERLDACLTTHKATGAPVHWRPLRGAPESAQIGCIHWSAQPSVTRSDDLVSHHRIGAPPMGGMTVRPKKNVTFHIGVERTTPRMDAMPALEATC
jgi:GT2 family glycosyltransferase